MPLVPISSEFPAVEIKFILPVEDFDDQNIETFEGFLIEDYAIYKSSYRELYLVKVKPSETEWVLIAEGPSMCIGKLRCGQRMKTVVNEMVDRLRSMNAWDFVSTVLMNDPMSVELNLTEKGSSK